MKEAFFMFDLSKKRALVTGSTQGIGYAIAKSLCMAGAEVFVHCSADLEKSQRIAAEIGAFGAVTSRLENENEVIALPEKVGDIDILVLNASVQIPMKWYEIDTASFEKQINVNLKSTLLLMQKFYPYMKGRRYGRIVTIGSVQQYKPHIDMAVYAATKSAVMNLVTNIASQVADEGITVNNISPGVINTPRNAVTLSNEKYRADVKDDFGFEMISQNRFTTAQIDKNTWTVEMLDMLIEWIASDPRGEESRDLDWTQEYYLARNSDPNDTQTAL